MPLVLDSSAALALLRDDDEAEEVASLLSVAEKTPTGHTGVLSAVSVVELWQWAPADAVARFLKDGGPIAVEAFTAKQAETAAEMRGRTGDVVLPLAARACLALALETKWTPVTADASWRGLSLGLTICNVSKRL